MIEDNDIVAIRQWCLDKSLSIPNKEVNTTMATHIEEAKIIEGYLLEQRDKEKPQLGRK